MRRRLAGSRLRTVAALALALGAALAAPAYAHRGLAPWENAGLPGGDTCMQCHFDGEAVVQSEALTVEGLPEAIEAGATYSLIVRLADRGMGAAGYIISAINGTDEPAGGFAAVDEGVEAQGAQARSTTKAAIPEDGEIQWRMEWTAPEEIAGPIRFYLMANAGNDDESPYGDTIHMKILER